MNDNRSAVTAAVLVLAIILLACGSREVAKPKRYVDASRGIQFEYPADWTVEDLREQNVLLLSSPVVEKNWQTNIFIELRTDADSATPHERRAAALADNLSRQKNGFRLQSMKNFTHPSGVPAAELIYTHDSQGVALTEREILLWLTPGKVLFVTGSAVTSLWTKYEPQLNVVFDSVRRM